MVTGVRGSGKYSLAKAVSAGLLRKSADAIDDSPNFMPIRVADGQSEISIDAIRDLRKRLKLKSADPSQDRLIVIEDAEKMSAEAQNALLKTLEEPPANTTIILTAATPLSMLPTIVSRTWALPVQPIGLETARRYYSDVNQQELEKAWSLSGGAAGLLNALLRDEGGHSLKAAVDRAKQFISSPLYNRLIQADAEAADSNQFAIFLQALTRIMSPLHRRSIDRHDVKSSVFLENRKLLFGLQAKLRKRASPRLVGLELALKLKT
jgi:hypothetical protein